MYSILSTIDDVFNDTCWQKYFGLLQELNEKYKSRLSAKTWHELKSRHLSFREKEKVYHSSVIFEGGRAVGWIVFWILNYETDHRITMVFFDARGEVFPKNLIELAGQWFLERMNRYDCREAMLEAGDYRIRKFANDLGAEELNRFNKYIIRTDEANMKEIEKWLKVIPQQNADLKLEFHRNIPDEYIPGLALLLTDTLRDMPEERDSDMPVFADPDEIRRQAQWRRENDNPAYFCLLFNEKLKWWRRQTLISI